MYLLLNFFVSSFSPQVINYNRNKSRTTPCVLDCSKMQEPADLKVLACDPQCKSPKAKSAVALAHWLSHVQQLMPLVMQKSYNT